ncbi:RbsD/FucU family protein [Paenibacillus sp. PL91]|nr:RbsD/FucU family protein [Paenibacillus sp. PL91]
MVLIFNKNGLKTAYAIGATGEKSLFANVILKKGVVRY